MNWFCRMRVNYFKLNLVAKCNWAAVLQVISLLQLTYIRVTTWKQCSNYFFLHCLTKQMYFTCRSAVLLCSSNSTSIHKLATRFFLMSLFYRILCWSTVLVTLCSLNWVGTNTLNVCISIHNKGLQRDHRNVYHEFYAWILFFAPKWNLYLHSTFPWIFWNPLVYMLENGR